MKIEFFPGGGLARGSFSEAREQCAYPSRDSNGAVPSTAIGVNSEDGSSVPKAGDEASAGAAVYMITHEQLVKIEARPAAAAVGSRLHSTPSSSQLQ